MWNYSRPVFAENNPRLPVLKRDVKITRWCITQHVISNRPEFLFNLVEMEIYEWADRQSKQIVMPGILFGEKCLSRSQSQPGMYFCEHVYRQLKNE
jgi:hypothetical protein